MCDSYHYPHRFQCDSLVHHCRLRTVFLCKQPPKTVSKVCHSKRLKTPTGDEDDARLVDLAGGFQTAVCKDGWRRGTRKEEPENESPNFNKMKNSYNNIFARKKMSDLARGTRRKSLQQRKERAALIANRKRAIKVLKKPADMLFMCLVRDAAIKSASIRYSIIPSEGVDFRRVVFADVYSTPSVDQSCQRRMYLLCVVGLPSINCIDAPADPYQPHGNSLGMI